VRDRAVIGLRALATLQKPRTNAPTALPAPVISTFPEIAPATPVDPSLALSAITDGWLISTLGIALKAHVEAMPADSATIKSRVIALKTVGDLSQYFQDVLPIIKNKQAQARQQRVAARNTQQPPVSGSARRP
jgi:hypothetical protein